jgi:uncharacterized OsmC-like protein
MPKAKKGQRSNKPKRDGQGPVFKGRFLRLREHFKKDPGTALRSLFADVERMDGLHSYARTGKFIVECDEPEGFGGTDKAPTPTQLLLASLAHCQAITLQIYAEAMGIAIDDIKVKVTGTLDLRGYFSVDDAEGPIIDPGLQEVTIKTSIVTNETEAGTKGLIKAMKGKGVCLSSVEKGVKIRYSYHLNGRHLRL